jgi:anti-sigma regulatory factor (Ser/Thr protein kinase)
MRSPAAGDGAGYVHSTALCDTDEALIEVVVVHLQAALDAGDPVIAALSADQADRVRSARDPSDFLRTMPAPPPDPLEANRPDAELLNPRPADSRRAVCDLAPATRLSIDDVDALVMATSEAVTNAVLPGRPPVTLRVWAARERIVVTVTDRGHGPQDPYAGLPQPVAATGGGGYGLWLINHLTTVAYRREADGFTIHLVGGDPMPLHHGGEPPPANRGADTPQGRLGQELDVPVRSMHSYPLPIRDQPGGILHAHDGRQAVLPRDHCAMGHQGPHLGHQARDRDD